PAPQRTLSSPVPGLRSRFHDPAITSASLQRELVAQTKQAGGASCHHYRILEAGDEISSKVAAENFVPTLRWYARISSQSVPLLLAKSARWKTVRSGLPLKTCLKKKAHSTAPTPPGEVQYLEDDLSGSRTLRRMKTVDFDEANKSLLALPNRSTKSKNEIDTPDQRPVESARQATKLNMTRSGKAPGPKMLDTVKSSLANPATTHTDVHVVAITPSKNTGVTGERIHNTSTDPATPTMQIVASDSGSYEIVWDDVPAEHNIRPSRRGSSASHALKAVSSTAARGLLRVNSKLTDWSGSWKAPSDTFAPTIVVYPDGDGQEDLIECAVDDELMVFAPPNSQRTSATPSRLPSRPVSTPLTRAASQESLTLGKAAQEGPSEVDLDWVSPLDDALVVPTPPVQSTRHLNAQGRPWTMPKVRKLSNVEEVDFKFHDHRDSLTLAHARLMHTGGVSPELFTHRDSVSLAKKRMYAKNHAVSAARVLPARNSYHVTSAPAISMDDTYLDVHAVKEHAPQALKSRKSVSMLDAKQVAPYSHIRIME
ncbi:hypothetical protein BDU57DRAFT_427151, partial [Ampelomyces quisqualis]